MTDSVGTRVARIVSGSVHALLDAVENAVPEATMAQAIREVDQVADEVRGELGKAAANKHMASTNLMEQNRRHEELAGQIELAITQGKEDLASAAIARQLDIEAQIPVLEQAISEAAAKEKEMDGYLSALRAKKRDMEEALNQFIASRASMKGPVIHDNSGAVTSRKLDEAESAFDRVLARQTGIAGIGKSPDAQTAAKLKELNELARNNRIAERLAEAKAKQNKKN